VFFPLEHGGHLTPNIAREMKLHASVADESRQSASREGAYMKIAVIGTGNIGATIGTKWRSAGHEVAFGATSARDDGPGGAPVLVAAEALAEADVVLLAVPGDGAAQPFEKSDLRIVA